MVFSSVLFLFGFLPAFFFVYYLTPARLKNAVALAGSAFFYSWGAADVFGVLVIGLVIDYVLAGRIAAVTGEDERSVRLRKRLLTVSVAVNLGALAYYKYTNFGVGELNRALGALGVHTIRWHEVILPIGISFFTFHKISYVVDVYRKVSKPAGSFVTFALYVLVFPQLIAGPIIRYHDVAEQLARRTHDVERVAHGAFRFAVGLGKKVLIANQLAVTADLVFGAEPPTLSTPHAWLGVLCYSLQIYFDFSGYSDMALGLGHMLGLSFRENFDCPYRSLNITEFWRRWHISLSSFMKEYLYVPLGGNRVPPARRYLNLWIVFLASGLWHGANWTFIAWGVFHGSFLVLDKLLWIRVTERWPRPVSMLLTFVLVMFGWVLFRAPTLGYAVRYMGRMLAVTSYAPTTASRLTAELIEPRGWVALGVACFLSFAPLSSLGERVAKRFEAPATGLGQSAWRYAGALFCLFWSSVAVASTSYNPFIYFRF